MRLVIQRVLRASVSVRDAVIGSIGGGLLVLAAVEKGETEDVMSGRKEDPRAAHLQRRRRKDESLDVETGGAILAVSQFTLAGSIARGRRPEFRQRRGAGAGALRCSRYSSASFARPASTSRPGASGK